MYLQLNEKKKETQFGKQITDKMHLYVYGIFDCVIRWFPLPRRDWLTVLFTRDTATKWLMFENGKVANHVFRYAIESEYWLHRQQTKNKKERKNSTECAVDREKWVEMNLQWNDRDVWSN